MKKGFIILTMLMLVSFSFAANLTFSGMIDFKINLYNSKTAKDDVQQLFTGDGNDAQSLTMKLAGETEDGITAYSLELKSDAEDKEDGLNNYDNVIGLSLTSKPNDYTEIGIGVDLMFSKGDDDRIMAESKDSDGVYIKTKGETFALSFYPMNTPTKVGGSFKSWGSQNAREDGKSDAAAKAVQGDDYFNSGIILDLMPGNGVTFGVGISNKKLAEDSTKNYNSFGYKGYLGVSKDNFTLDVEYIGNTQDDDKNKTAATKSNGSYAITKSQASIRGTFSATDMLSLGGEYFMSQTNERVAGVDEQGTGMKVNGSLKLVDLDDVFGLEATDLVLSGAYWMFGEYLISDEAQIGKDGAYNKIVLGLSLKYAGFSIGPELEMGMADEKIWQENDKATGTLTDSYTVFGVNVTYKW